VFSSGELAELTVVELMLKLISVISFVGGKTIFTLFAGSLKLPGKVVLPKSGLSNHLCCIFSTKKR